MHAKKRNQHLIKFTCALLGMFSEAWGKKTNISPEIVNAGMLETSVIGDLFYVKNLEAVRRSGAERCGSSASCQVSSPLL